jgi:predicted MFS family arabinose efflux permease
VDALTARDAGRIHYAWVILGATAVVLLAASGLQSAFGVFIKPMEAEFGWNRTALSLVASLSFLFNGASGPIMGRLADRWGGRVVLATSGVLLGVGALGAALIVSLWQLHATVGIVIAVGAGGASSGIAAVMASRWFDARRGLALGIAGGAMAAGQLLIVPLAMWLMLSWGWRSAFVVLGVGFLAIVLPLILTLIRDDPRDMGLEPYGAVPGVRTDSPANRSVERTTLKEAVTTASFWLLAGSFWVCGYTAVGVVLTHLIPYATEHGFHGGQAAQALGVMGAFNIVGTIASGWICDRYGQRIPLATYYGLRGLSLVFLPYVGTLAGLFAWAVVFGLNFISTVPATTALTAKIYGRYSVGELSGWIFFSHQLGSAVGALAGGYLYDRLGDYTMAFHSAALVAFAAALMVLAIRERPVSRRPPEAIAVAPGV